MSTIQKVYGQEGQLTPAFDVTPDVGLAALDVEFIDQQVTTNTVYQKSYTEDVLPTIQKEYA